MCSNRLYTEGEGRNMLIGIAQVQPTVHDHITPWMSSNALSSLNFVTYSYHDASFLCTKCIALTIPAQYLRTRISFWSQFPNNSFSACSAPSDVFAYTVGISIIFTSHAYHTFSQQSSCSAFRNVLTRVEVRALVRHPKHTFRHGILLLSEVYCSDTACSSKSQTERR